MPTITPSPEQEAQQALSLSDLHALIITTYGLLAPPPRPQADDLPHPDLPPRAAYGLSFSRKQCEHLERAKRLPARWEQDKETAWWFVSCESERGRKD